MTDEAGKTEASPDASEGSDGFSDFAIHLARTTQNNTLHLSAMADQKASILMGATFLVFSLSVSRALVGELSWAMTILAASAFLSSVCAVIAVLPSFGKSHHGSERTNKLFFGHFAPLDEERWKRDVLAELRTDEAVLRMMLHDIYQNGQVLYRRKYRFLGLAYRIFIAGLFVTMAVYLVEFFGEIGS